MNLSHLHVHSDYSLLKSSASVPKILRKAFSMGCKNVALTDIDNLFGAMDFYHSAKKIAKEYEMEDPNPILGLQVGLVSSLEKRESEEAPRLVLLAKNYDGYKNLIKLSSLSFTEGYRQRDLRPCIDVRLFSKYSGNLVVMTGSYDGGVFSHLMKGEDKKAYLWIKNLSQWVDRDDLYVEILRNNVPGEDNFIAKALRMASEEKLKVVACNEVFYIEQGDVHSNKILWSIGTGDSLSTPENRKTWLKGENYHMRTLEEMENFFKDMPETLKRAEEIGEKCRLVFPSVKPRMPKLEKERGSKELLTELCEVALSMRSKVDEAYSKRLSYEISVIDKMGFCDYFLIVSDLIAASKREGIIVGPGRGSAAGSLVSYALDITKLDPIEHGLLFERFLNPERVSMPDIDIDFQDNRRDEVIEYCRKKYGSEKVAQIITYGTLKAKAIFKDVARYFEINFEESNRITQFIDANKTIEEAYEDNENFRNAVQSSPTLREVFLHARNLEGLNRHTGVHASGVIIADDDVSEYAPLVVDKEGHLCTQYEGSKLEEFCGLIKMDLLGLSTLSILDNALKNIKEQENVYIDLDKIDFTDKKTYNIFSSGRTVGVFQFESRGMRRYLKELRPTELSHLIAMNAMFRPGPMSWIPIYIAKKNGATPQFGSEEEAGNFDRLKRLCEKNKALQGILAPTNLIPIYQEQIMEIGRSYAGFSLGESDLMRRAMGKKDVRVLVDLKQQFIEGACLLGNRAEDADFLFEKIILPFSGYGFNKSHSACYAYVAFQTAYLKAHYTKYFMASMMNNDFDSPAKLRIFIEDAMGFGVGIDTVDINANECDFVVKGGRIKYGLAAIKGLGKHSVAPIIEEREKGGAFKSLSDFLIRFSKIDKIFRNRQVIEQLIKAGAFASIETLNKEQMLKFYSLVMEQLEKKKAKTLGGQGDMFSSEGENESFDHFRESLSSLSLSEENDEKYEVQSIGFSFKEMEKWGKLERYDHHSTLNIGDKESLQNGKKGEIVAIVGGIRSITTKKGDAMAMMTLSNAHGEIQGVLFPSSFEKMQEKFFSLENRVAVVYGKVKKDGMGTSFVVDNMEDVDQLSLVETQPETGQKETTKNMTQGIVQEKTSTVSKPPAVEEVKEYDFMGVEIDEGNVHPQYMKEIKRVFQNYEKEGENAPVILYFYPSQTNVKFNFPFPRRAIEKVAQELKRLAFVIDAKGMGDKR